MSEVVFEDKNVTALLRGILKNVDQINERGQKYVGLLSALVFSDIMDHFRKQEGPEGAWKAWSDSYSRYMARIGKSGNLILQDTGRLRQGWQPTNYRTSSEGVLWFNPVEYAAAHNEGTSRMPRREFAYLSNSGMKNIEEQTLKFIMELK